MTEGAYKLAILVIFAITLAISGSYRLRARRLAGTISRRAESAGLRLVRVGLSLPMLFALIAIFLRPQWIEWARLPLPTWARLGGVVLGLCSALLTWWVMRNLGSNVSETVLTKPGQNLVTTGPYRFVRHPLYTVGLLSLVSIGLIAESGFILGFVILGGLAFSSIIIPREEAELIARFGDDYRDYRRHSGALLPRFWGPTS